MAKDQSDELVEEFNLIDGMVILQPIAMRIPNRHGVYSLSNIRSEKEISYEEFLLRYASHSVEVKICFDENPSIDTIFERSELAKAYGFGRDGWYIFSSYKSESK